MALCSKPETVAIVYIKKYQRKLDGLLSMKDGSAYETNLKIKNTWTFATPLIHAKLEGLSLTCASSFNL